MRKSLCSDSARSLIYQSLSALASHDRNMCVKCGNLPMLRSSVAPLFARLSAVSASQSWCKTLDGSCACCLKEENRPVHSAPGQCLTHCCNLEFTLNLHPEGVPRLEISAFSIFALWPVAAQRRPHGRTSL